jgi:hypothetical protein
MLFASRMRRYVGENFLSIMPAFPLASAALFRFFR